MMRDFFESIAWFFEAVLFAPFNWLRALELDSWFAANIINWIFALIGFAAFLFWMKQLKRFNENKEENRDPTAHSFLG